MLSEQRRSEIADFLRTRRARLSPGDVGLPAGERRRTRGLRREEVAALASVSVEWYTRLEQARDVRASEAVMRRLADALRLAPSESRHLLTLGGYGGEVATGGSSTAPAHLQRLIDRLGNCPAWVVDARADLVAWNRAATVIYGELDAMPAQERNVYVQMFLRPRLRETLVDWEPHARDCVARLRAAHARNVDDAWFGGLVEQLRAGSAEFTAWWNMHDVHVPPSGVKSFEHRTVGRLTFEYSLLDVVGDTSSALQLVTYTPVADTGTEARVAELLRSDGAPHRERAARRSRVRTLARVLNVVLLASCGLSIACARTTHRAPATFATGERMATYANPIDLPYRYQLPATEARLQFKPGEPYREAADPTVVRWNGRYWLFASHSSGYWYSTDLLHWSFVAATGYDVDKFAPTVVVIGGRMFLATSENVHQIWTTDDPMSGRWREAATVDPGYQDPALFLDDDGKLYMYDGLAPTGPLHAYELDRNTFQVVRKNDIPQSRSKETRGWEVPGDRNERTAAPSYVEGSWMTKHDGRYYLEYSAPGTEFKTYANGVLVADAPLGPFSYQDYSPFAVKPSGFITGAGHGSTFQTADGDWWHIGTMTISRRHIFERRLGIFPTSFTRAGEIVADTYLGDYPHFVGGQRGLTGWMLLSRRKVVTASSTLDGFPPENAVDEDVRTWWSAKSGDSTEWFQIDLGALKRIDAVQINFADQGSHARGASGDVYDYVLELSDDGRSWRTVIDHARSGRDAPHDYEVLPTPERARFVRLRNVHSPDGGTFSLYDLRVFGSGEGSLPMQAGPARVVRSTTDARRATVSWTPSTGAEFYVVRLGIRPDLLNQSYQVYDGQTSVDVGSLNAGVKYCVAVDAVNENGITRGGGTTCME